MRSIEACGKAGIYGLRYLSVGHRSKEYFHRFVQNEMLRKEYVNQTFDFLPEAKKVYEENTNYKDFELAQKQFFLFTQSISTKGIIFTSHY